MTDTAAYRPLRDEEIQTMQEQGCSTEDWSLVQVADDFQPERIRRCHFSGEVRIGSLAGTVETGGGVQKACGIEDAYISCCTIGDGVRIANIGTHLANYDIGSGAVIENVGTMETAADATFGNGVEIEPLNEGGGREVVLFDRLDSQFAYLLCVHRYRAKLVEKLQAIATAEAAKAKADRGTIGADSRIRNVQRIADVNIGECAIIDGAALLENGTVLSSREAPTIVGTDVQADDFIIAEGSKVMGGAIVSKSFVGQGCQIGKQFSAEGSLFFANCEGFHGEACSVFAGPYTVTHHKSTLLIAGMFSFYNAGSGTNQSNHLYKLGPVHEGKLERGCKTGSFSYMMWPCRVGPFSVVFGKHTTNFDTQDFPFSSLDATPHGRCQITPGFNLTTVGTVRDGAKWPARDRRKGSVLRDRISFDVFSPLTVGRMIAGSARMKELRENTERSVDMVKLGGADVKRVILNRCERTYRMGIEMYLLDKVMKRVETAEDRDAATLREALGPAPEPASDTTWVDIGGQMMPRERLEELCEAIVSGEAADLDALNSRLDAIHASYGEDEWAWVRQTYGDVIGGELDNPPREEMEAVADKYEQARGKFLRLVKSDAEKEFSGPMRTGFGQDGTDEEASDDFSAVRGEFDTNKFVVDMKNELAALAERVEEFKQMLDKFY